MLEQVTTDTPSRASVRQLIKSLEADRIMTTTIDDDAAMIRDLLRLTGVKCRQCGHAIVADHDRGHCQLCSCVRVRKESKKGFEVSELFDMEGH